LNSFRHRLREVGTPVAFRTTARVDVGTPVALRTAPLVEVGMPVVFRTAFLAAPRADVGIPVALVKLRRALGALNIRLAIETPRPDVDDKRIKAASCAGP
jgi:hypothetical protein